MNTKFQTNFTVMPTDANYMYPLIFGGAFFAQMDLCAARTVQRLLYDSEADGAVTHKVEHLTFNKPCYVGDLIYLTGEVKLLGAKSIVVQVTAERECKSLTNGWRREIVATGTFIFVSIHSLDLAHRPDFLDYTPHGLSL